MKINFLKQLDRNQMKINGYDIFILLFIFLLQWNIRKQQNIQKYTTLVYLNLFLVLAMKRKKS